MLMIFQVEKVDRHDQPYYTKYKDTRHHADADRLKLDGRLHFFISMRNQHLVKGEKANLCRHSAATI